MVASICITFSVVALVGSYLLSLLKMFYSEFIFFFASSVLTSSTDFKEFGICWLFQPLHLQCLSIVVVETG